MSDGFVLSITDKHMDKCKTSYPMVNDEPPIESYDDGFDPATMQ
jgi:hypothetical protein